MFSKQKAYEFIRAHRFAVISTINEDGTPEAALIGIAITPKFELIFDTINVTRKCLNLRRDPHAAFVIGWSGDFLQHCGGYETLQYQGLADELKEPDLDQLLEVYLATHPEGLRRQGWPGLTYFRVRPLWLRVSNYYRPQHVEEIRFGTVTV